MNIEEIKVGMNFTTKSGFTAKVKSIDNRFPMDSEGKFPIIYADDDKTCWSLDSIAKCWE